MAELKDAWVKTAKSFVLATNDLVNALGDSVRAGREKVVKWAQTDNNCVETEATEIPTEDAEEAPAAE